MSALSSAHPSASANATLRLATLAYTIKETADAIRCSERHVRREISAGRLVAKRSGSRVLVLAADLAAYLAELPSAK